MKKKELNSTLSVIFIIFYFPFGIPFMWLTNSFSKKTRWIITLSFFIAAFLGFAIIILWTSSPGYIQ